MKTCLKGSWALKILLLCILSVQTIFTASAIELSADFGYDKQVYGANRQNSLVNRSYSGTMAWALFAYTSLEINFAYSEEVTTQADTIAVSGTTTNLTHLQNNVENTVYGIGLRQAFASRKAFIRPMISLGYAKQFIKSYTDYTFVDTDTGIQTIVTEDAQKTRQDSVFAAFTLQIRLTRSMALRGSVKTVFPAFETDEAKNYLKYLVGLTWML